MNLKSLLLLLSLLLVYAVVDHFWLTPHIAYVNAAKLMVGFSDAAKVETEMKAEDDKWRSQLKQLQDSLQASIDKRHWWSDGGSTAVWCTPQSGTPHPPCSKP